MASPSTQRVHTIVLSDLHMADAEPPHPFNPLWKRYKRPKLFLDRAFRALVERVQNEVPAGETIELILNGDIFDFDSVMVIPKKRTFRVTWLERKRGLFAEEPKSRFKIKVILEDHAVWVQTLRQFLLAGHRLVFVIGNHDMELHWPGVQSDIIEHFDLPEDKRQNVRFCEWFYLSGGDTLIEHGNQFDEYSMCADPINPLIRKGFKAYVRLPFGNLAGRYLINGMGLFNPHVEDSYIKSSLYEYFVFFFRYIIRTQPLIMWTWFWGAIVTAFYSFAEGLLPSMRDPLMVEARVEAIGARSNAEPRVVRQLRALHVHPAYFNPLKIMRELWLDRAFLLLLIFAASLWIFTTVNVFIHISAWFFFVPCALLLPPFVFYARNIQSDVYKVQEVAERRVPISAQIAGVQRVIHGHTHREVHKSIKGIELLNTGTWSPAYRDVECNQPYGSKCFAWVRPGAEGRTSALYEWKEKELTFELIPRLDDPAGSAIR